MLSYWRKRRSATKTFNVVLLDGSTVSLQLESRCSGVDLVRRALETQRILSNQEIFGLTTLTDSYRKWLNLGKPVKKQVSGHSPYTLHLCVWAYPRDHQTILQSTTRHQLYLQVKQDLLQGRLVVANETVRGSVLGYIVQREVGDFDQAMCGEGYIQEMALLPAMARSLEDTISSQHRANRGTADRDSEERVLTQAQGEFTYGTHTYTVQDSLSRRSTVQLSVCPAGIRISQSITAVVTYEWEMIERVSHKGKQLYIDLLMGTKTAPPSGPTQFTCPSSAVCSTLCHWCVILRDYYCHGNTPSTKSRLRRFFSSRRSMRRRPVVEPSRRLSAQVDERRSSFGNDNRYTKVAPTKRPSITQPPAGNDESRGLVVYGASGLASHEQPSYDITPITEVVIHTEDLKAEQQNHVTHNQVSHDHNHRSHDQLPMESSVHIISHDLDSPEIKSIGNLRNRPSKSGDYSKRSHDPRRDIVSPVSHDSSVGSHDHSSTDRSLYDSPHRSHEHSRRLCDSPSRSHDHSRRSHDSLHRSYDHSKQSLESPHRSHNGHRRSHDHLRSHDSPHRSNDSPHRSHDSPHRSHDSLSHDGFKRYELGRQRKSSLESSPIIESGLPRRRSLREQSPSERASSLTRHVLPDYALAEDRVWDTPREDVHQKEVEHAPRYIDPAAKPKNRIRLSLPESAYYDSRRGTRLNMSSRRARNTSIISTTSLSQPLEGTTSQWGISAKLGSIASLEAQASLAELSQADSYVDPHMRSFVFQASQLDTATEL